MVGVIAAVEGFAGLVVVVGGGEDDGEVTFLTLTCQSSKLNTYHLAKTVCSVKA